MWALSSIVYALTDFRPGADIDLQNWYGIKNILNITDSDGFTVYGNMSLNDSLNMLQRDVFNVTNVNTTNVHTTNLYATNLETNLDGTGYDIVAENINASNFYDDGTNLNDKFIDEGGDTVSAGSLFNWALSNLINITDLNATNVYQNGNKVLDAGTSFGGEVSGTYNNIIIDDNALDDQYFDSESDLTALLDDNYVDVSGDTMSGNLNMNDYNITGANLISATKLTGDVDKSDVEGDVNTFIDVDGDTAVANSVFDWSDSNFTNINSAWIDYIYMTNPINDGNISNSLTIDNTGSVDFTALTNYPAYCSAHYFVTGVNDTLQCSALADDDIPDALTLNSSSSVDKGALANTGTLGFDWTDDEVADTLTLDSSSTVDGIAATNLVDKSASETITGSWTFDSAILGFNNTLQSNGEGLVGYWAFDENTGTTAYDSSREGNDGTLYDANSTNADGNTPPQWVSGRFGTALSFDGVDDYVRVPDSASLDITDGITVSAWVKLNDAIDNDGIVCKKLNGASPNSESYSLQGSWTNDGYGELKGGYPGRALFQIRQQDGNWWVVGDNETTPTGQWIYLVGVADNSNDEIRFYRDADLKNTISVPNLQIQANNAPLHIGWDGYSSYFNGTIDEVKIFNRSLTAQEIRAEYLLGLASHDASGNYVKKTGDTMSGNLNTDYYLNVTSSSYPACSSSYEGIIVYNSSSKQFLGCNSTDWVVLG